MKNMFAAYEVSFWSRTMVCWYKFVNI